MRIGPSDATGTRSGAETIPSAPLETALSRAVAVLEADGLVALPTETVYGLAARAASESAVARLYAAKGRPAHNPLIVHVASLADAAHFADIEPARPLADLWPGPLTAVLALTAPGAVVPTARAGGSTVAVRIPDSPLFRAVAAAVGPLVAPSANRSGRVSPTTAAAVAADLGAAVDLIVDAGACRVGVESTVLDLTGAPRLLRPGAVTLETLRDRLGAIASGGEADPGPLRSPGLLTSHYAPAAKVRLDVEAGEVRPDEAWLAFGDTPSPVPPERTFRLSPNCNLDEAARGLYEGLRRLDATGPETIAVSPIPAVGVGLAIRDRLQRAAAPRSADDAPQRPEGDGAR